MTKLNHSLIFPVIIIENGDQRGLKKKKLNAKTFGTPFHPNYGCNSYRGREDTSFHGGKINRCHGDNEVVSSAYYQDLVADSYI